ncbi:hypothetical protein [Marinobacter sediminicola]|uniref:hypothetical protein n=1 Tax=Marinobacter sediminicola TaxID=3072994 RepID=UPI002811F76D|nr:hypothetical protein [Marinobacter sp. F26243]
MRTFFLLSMCLLLAGCASTKSILGVHPGVVENEDGATKIYDLENIAFLAHSDSFWHQLYLIKDGDSEFRPDILADVFIDVSVDEKRWVNINEFEGIAVRSAIIEDLKEKRKSRESLLDNAVFVIEGFAEFSDYDFESESYSLEEVRVPNTDALTYSTYRDNDGSLRRYRTFFQGASTPPIIEPVRDMVLLNHTTYRSSDRFLSKLSVNASGVAYKFPPNEAEQLKSFFSDDGLKVSIVSELVSYSDYAIQKKDYVVFEHNVLCYIFHNDQRLQTKYYENSDINNRSREICKKEVDRLLSGEPLEEANIRPSFSVFPEGAITDRGERVRSNLDKYF